MKQKNTQKRLQKKSKYADYDINKDGVVSDDELEHMNQMIVKDDEAVLASFKRPIAQIDEIQQVMTMSKNLLKKELTLHELQEITKVEAT